MDDKVESLIQTLTQCAKYCDLCAAACLGEEDLSSVRNCINTDLACSAACKNSSQLLIWENNFVKTSLHLCAEICADCASECEKHHHEHCKLCARVCREAAAQCMEFITE